MGVRKSFGQDLKLESLAFGAGLFTGIRPTSSLTVANFLSAVKPTIQLQALGERPLVFVADLHALTTHSVQDTMKYSHGIVADYIALGLDPGNTDIFIQSDLKAEVFALSNYLMKLVTVAELLRLPTLKDKIKEGASAESASVLLALYPILMASDILLQRANKVPVGEDQVAHIEFTRKIARRFNAAYGDVFPMPEALERQSPLRILGLKGTAKMSKSNPEDALFLTDLPDVIEKKIKRATTASEGQMTPALQSNIVIAQGLASSSEQTHAIDAIISEHLEGKQVMGAFKKLFSSIVIGFVQNFQRRRATISDKMIQDLCSSGISVARTHASKTMELVECAVRSTSAS